LSRRSWYINFYGFGFFKCNNFARWLLMFILTFFYCFCKQKRVWLWTVLISQNFDFYFYWIFSESVLFKFMSSLDLKWEICFEYVNLWCWDMFGVVNFNLSVNHSFVFLESVVQKNILIKRYQPRTKTIFLNWDSNPLHSTSYKCADY
jgi:hypothetical protein